MKKIIVSLFVMLTLATGSVKAFYKFKVQNNTDGQIKAWINFGGEILGVCNPKTYIINQGQYMEIDTAGCCIDQVTFDSTSGRGRGTRAYYYPSRTGYGISCKDSYTAIINTANGSIIAE